MDAFVEKIITDGSFIDLILFMMVIGLGCYSYSMKIRLDKKEQKIIQLTARYHLLNDQLGRLSLILQPVIKRSLLKQAADGEWSPYNALNGD